MQSSTRAKYVVLGHVAVETGRLLIADPSYTAESLAVVEAEDGMTGVIPFPDGTPDDAFFRGVCVETGIGDGVYPIEARIVNGRVESLIISFRPQGWTSADFAKATS